MAAMKKLHLGCGQRYLDGYINIDFPLSEHSVQDHSVADLYADIQSLTYPPGSIDEVRLHHVFEHFPRPIAGAFLAGWFSWLKPGGTLHIEVPDFDRTARIILNPFCSFKRKAVAERHLYGSHEAPWAVHCEGYTPQTLQKMLGMFMFNVDKISKISWKGTYNFEIIARKISHRLTKADFEKIASGYLGSFLLVETGSEATLLKVWMESYRQQVERSWASSV
jgi:Methyltransferase domain